MDKLELTDAKELTNQEKEVYRTLRTNLEFTGVENRVIAVTSCGPDEGKSTVSYNLGRTLASAGKTTLYIDADMRKSILANRHQIQGIEKGLSHYLSGQADMTEVVYSTNKKNFFMLPCGLFPVNPTELLGNGRLDKLLEGLKKTFDYIIIDTPPLGSVIDSAVIADECDGSIIVMESGAISYRFAQEVKEQLEKCDCPILGVILNKVDMSKQGYYGKYYGKQYGKYYGKYYGKDNNSKDQ